MDTVFILIYFNIFSFNFNFFNNNKNNNEYKVWVGSFEERQRRGPADI